MADRDHLVIQAIALRAFELHESAGSLHGRDHDDWFQAERELTSLPYIEADGLDLVIQIPINAENRTHILASISPWSILLITVPAASEINSCVAPDLPDLVRHISLPREVVPEEVMTSFDEHGLSLRLPVVLERSILPSYRSDGFATPQAGRNLVMRSLSKGSELIVLVGQQDSLDQNIEAAASVVDFGNGKN